ncbi:hypothetical protein PUN28_005349 [Cardiocondyla obscurior]|uniref:Uncharacterized protein n=1 Tax=Cardiocondyla obscurior TaxID=286306 RepID=A0AAW2GIP1_9HYME
MASGTCHAAHKANTRVESSSSLAFARGPPRRVAPVVSDVFQRRRGSRHHRRRRARRCRITPAARYVRPGVPSTADHRETGTRVPRKGPPPPGWCSPPSRPITARDHEGSARRADEIVYGGGWLARGSASRFTPGAPRVGQFLSYERGKKKWVDR